MPHVEALPPFMRSQSALAADTTCCTPVCELRADAQQGVHRSVISPFNLLAAACAVCR